jgi:hypothetical protein
MSKPKDDCYPNFEPQMDEEHEAPRAIKMGSIPQAAGYGFLDDIWDSDGDSIVEGGS